MESLLLSVFSVRLCRLLGLPQELFDVLAVLFRAVDHEMHLRTAAQPQPLGQLVPDVARGSREASQRGGLLGLGAHHADVDAGMFEVGRDPDFGHGGQPGKARVLQLARQHGADLVPDLFGDPLVAMARNGHLVLFLLCPANGGAASAQSNSISWPIRSRPNSRSDSAKTACSDCSRCPASPERLTTPTSARCHNS